MKISPFFTPTNPVTYGVYLTANKKTLSETEVNRINNILGLLMMQEDELMREISDQILNINNT